MVRVLNFMYQTSPCIAVQSQRWPMVILYFVGKLLHLHKISYLYQIFFVCKYIHYSHTTKRSNFLAFQFSWYGNIVIRILKTSIFVRERFNVPSIMWWWFDSDFRENRWKSYIICMEKQLRFQEKVIFFFIEIFYLHIDVFAGCCFFVPFQFTVS